MRSILKLVKLWQYFTKRLCRPTSVQYKPMPLFFLTDNQNVENAGDDAISTETTTPTPDPADKDTRDVSTPVAHLDPAPLVGPSVHTQLNMQNVKDHPKRDWEKS